MFWTYVSLNLIILSESTTHYLKPFLNRFSHWYRLDVLGLGQVLAKLTRGVSFQGTFVNMNLNPGFPVS